MQWRVSWAELAYWICDFCRNGAYGCQVVGGVTVFFTRILAVKYSICLPTLKGRIAPKTTC